jgi:hypothetical protein
MIARPEWIKPSLKKPKSFWKRLQFIDWVLVCSFFGGAGWFLATGYFLCWIHTQQRIEDLDR